MWCDAMRCEWGSLVSSSAYFNPRRIVSESPAALAGFDHGLMSGRLCCFCLLVVLTGAGSFGSAATETFLRAFSLLLEYSAAASNCSDSCGLTFICADTLLNVFGACSDWSFPPPDSFDVHLIIRIPLSSCEPSSWASCRESDTSMNEKLSSLNFIEFQGWFKAEADLDDQGVVRSIAVVTSIQ